MGQSIVRLVCFVTIATAVGAGCESGDGADGDGTQSVTDTIIDGTVPGDVDIDPFVDSTADEMIADETALDPFGTEQLDIGTIGDSVTDPPSMDEFEEVVVGENP